VDTFSAQNARTEFTMRPKKHETYSSAFRKEAVRQALESRAPLTKLAQDLGVKYSTLRLWVKQAAEPDGSRSREDESSEVRRLRREVHELRLEREILKKATAFFAKHSR
jgi:transposase